MSDIKPGDEVRVFDVNGRRVGQPEGGWRGQVVKAGPKLVHITYPGTHQAQVFRKDTGRANDSYGHQWFLTPDEAVRSERRAVAEVVLRRHGIELSHSRTFTLEQAEALAEVVNGWDD